MNDYYCVLPYFSIETGFDIPDKNIYCCKLPDQTDIESIRSSIARHEKNPACSACWKLESRGLPSERESIVNKRIGFPLVENHFC